MTLETLKSPIDADCSAPDILTARLELIAITRAMVCADFARSPEFMELVKAEVPADWPAEGWDEQAYEYVLDKMTKYPDSHGWGRYIALKASDGGRRTLAGTCGATLPIEASDDVEIGYGLLPAYQGRGYATEATAALIAWIFEHPHIRSVKAQTFPHLEASLRVLAKNGFEFAGPGYEEGAILFRKHRGS